MGHVKCVIKFLKDKQLLQPPIIASVCIAVAVCSSVYTHHLCILHFDFILKYAQAFAIVIGVVPFLKNFVLTDDAPLFFFTDSCLILGYLHVSYLLHFQYTNLANKVTKL